VSTPRFDRETLRNLRMVPVILGALLACACNGPLFDLGGGPPLSPAQARALETPDGCAENQHCFGVRRPTDAGADATP
jgi:hypothetical protein